MHIYIALCLHKYLLYKYSVILVKRFMKQFNKTDFVIFICII